MQNHAVVLHRFARVSNVSKQATTLNDERIIATVVHLLLKSIQ